MFAEFLFGERVVTTWNARQKGEQNRQYLRQEAELDRAEEEGETEGD